jgi:phage tail sheath protein FI
VVEPVIRQRFAPTVRGLVAPIVGVPTAVTAFVGRCLRGPLNQPVRITSYEDYKQRFGGLWQPATLSYAVEQFFENGGREALIVRVANGARAPSLSLPAAGKYLQLEGVNPGTREYLRASVDYDGIDARDTDYFNLVLQRVRAPGSEQIEDQEIYRRVSVRADNARYLARLLATSQLARVRGVMPEERPDCIVAPGGRQLAGYLNSSNDGDDGGELSDYDIIGSASERRGIFALDACEHFNLLCVPPPTRELDVGAAALLVALRYCRQRQAMLVVDPPLKWTSAAEAIEGVSGWPFQSENALLYFPRLVAVDRLRGRPEVFASCGAAAGMLARADESSPVWASGEGEEPLLRPGLRPQLRVTDAERKSLGQLGVNTLQSVRAVARWGVSAHTMVPESSGPADWRYLAARRFGLYVVASIEKGTAWAQSAARTPATWTALRGQVTAFLETLERDGAFAGRSPDESYFVICDHRVNDAAGKGPARIQLVYGFAATRPGEFHAFLVTIEAGRSRTRPVSVNRMAFGGRRMEDEIETGIYRALELAH